MIAGEYPRRKSCELNQILGRGERCDTDNSEVVRLHVYVVQQVLEPSRVVRVFGHASSTQKAHVVGQTRQRDLRAVRFGTWAMTVTIASSAGISMIVSVAGAAGVRCAAFRELGRAGNEAPCRHRVLAVPGPPSECVDGLPHLVFVNNAPEGREGRKKWGREEVERRGEEGRGRVGRVMEGGCGCWQQWCEYSSSRGV